jgi:uncharacterized protein (TIGR00297 family)
LIAGTLGLGAGGLAYWRRALTLDGAIGAAAIGTIVHARGGLPADGALLAFFASSSALSRVGAQRKKQAPLAQAKGTRRDVWQVLANGGVAALLIGIAGQRGRAPYLGALAAAAADTWATELGLLSRLQPRMITTLSRVEPGTSGGVTPEGLAASAEGALAVGLTYSLLGGDWRGLPTGVIAGTFGSLVDSLLGATVQAAYRCEICDQATEEPIHPRCGQPTRLERGHPWVTNDAVNALATLAGAAAGALIWRATDQKTKRGGHFGVRRRVGSGGGSLLPP